MDVMDQLWEAVTRYFKQELTKGSYETWILGLKPIRLSDDTLYIEADSELHKRHIDNHYLLPLRQVIYEFFGRDIDVEIQVANRSGNTLSFGGDTQSPAPNDTLSNNRYHHPSSELNPKYTFENFVVGDGNKMAHAAALAVAEGPGRDYNPLFFFGGVGLGKTHLMQAIGHEVLRTHPDARVKYVTSETFTNDFIESIRTNTTPEFHEEYRGVDMLLVDDIQFIGNKQSTQEEFFHTFNALYNNNKHIVLTSDRDASQIPELEDRLVSRFKQGLSTDITPPDLETRIAILRNKAEVSQINIPDETLSYIAGQIDSNIRELEGALTSVQAYAVMNQESLTPDIAAKALRNYKNESPKATPSIAKIQEIVANYYDVTVDDLIGKKRKRQIVVPRQIAMYLAREITEASLPKIGQEFGGKDHTTVLHAYDKIETMLKESPDARNDVKNIKNMLAR
ncbi:MAG: chromosomal replication initiator protein DnaA [Aerococcus sp.]|nr:chromosomal replication initiator protein DnaA [Aerococcus sp.]